MAKGHKLIQQLLHGTIQSRTLLPVLLSMDWSADPCVYPSALVISIFHSDVHSSKKGYVYELYCLHEATMSIKEAAGQCKSLAEQLWPLSREAIAPFVLIN